MKSHIQELSQGDRVYISELFSEKVVGKLKRLHARLGVINCEFAGEQYKNWNITFRSRGAGFDIVEFNYDEDASGVDLDL